MSPDGSSKGIVPPRGSRVLEPLRRRPRAYLAAAMGASLLSSGGLGALWYYDNPASSPQWLPTVISLLLLLGTALAVRCGYLLRTEQPQPYDESGSGGGGPVLW